MAVGEKDGSAGLGEAGDLLGDGLLEASRIRLESKGRGQLGGVILDGLWIILWNGLHGGKIALDALLLEGGFIEVGIGANEETWLALDGGTKRFEIATSFRRDKEKRLLGVFWDGNGGAFGRLLVPGVDLGEPVVGRFVCGSAKEGDDEQ